MSITSLNSQPEKRRVRFSLPEAKLNLNTDKYRILSHGTSKYVNGTLINVTTSTISPSNDTGKYNTQNELNSAGFKSNLKSKGNTTKDSSQNKVPPHALLKPIELTSVNSHNKLNKLKRNSEKSFKSLPIIDKKFSSLEDLNDESINDDYTKNTLSDYNTTNSNLNRFKSSDDVRDQTSFKLKNGTPKLITTTTITTFPIRKQFTPNCLRLPSEYSDNLTPSYIPSQNTESSFAKRMQNNEISDDDAQAQNEKNLDQFFDFVDKWRNNRIAGNKKIENIFRNSSFQSRCSFTNVQKSSSLLSARLKAFKMSLDQVPVVTKLLRASRSCNEMLLKDCFKEILECGISIKDLNATDKSGRTALSYVCSTNLTNFLELFLHLPGIDVNKSDNEGNTPLHFAAQAGQNEIINMLLTKSRDMTIDAKNNLGFTPLMKAALQGRTKCAKLLLFAGASPVETDPGRGFRADQWARYTGRHTCAEMIETTARAKLLEKSTSSSKWTNEVIPRSQISNTPTQNVNGLQQQQHSGGFRSKFRKVFPSFGFSLKDKHKDNKNRNSNGFVSVNSKHNEKNGEFPGDIVSYLTAATLCVSGPAIANKQIIKSLVRPLQVPKLEVTYANNNALIKKYENMPNSICEKEPPKIVKKSVVSKKSTKTQSNTILATNGKTKVHPDSFF